MSGTISPVGGIDGAYTAIRAARWAAAVANGYEVPLPHRARDPYLGHNPAGAPAVMLTASRRWPNQQRLLGIRSVDALSALTSRIWWSLPR